ncbi:endonuclease domain-containing protein [Stieleria varia]|uniref:DUF559 domain-containing protein n=1 Tax=Stieleria varia TaxID=2528005 RepID=A0A5C6AZH7_9BACT|nr:endonuclease domain-containing protein [Stieleria varia]TWU04917.1 hypothetical protein Pla52n_29620 [Stieleria varia]
MNKKLNPIDFAREQRKSGNTYEHDLWQLLRNRQRLGFKFRRQQPLGIYTADFFCPDARLVIEIDGKDHFTNEGKLYDAARDRWMQSQGIHVLRFTGKQVDLDMRGVLDAIDAYLRALTPSPPAPLPQGERGARNDGGES